MRTTSSLESMNSTLRRMANQHHPGFFKFIDMIRLHEFSKSTDLMEMLKSNNTIRCRKSQKVKDLDVKIKQLTKDLKEMPEMNSGIFLEELAKVPNLLPSMAGLLNKTSGKVRNVIPIIIEKLYIHKSFPCVFIDFFFFKLLKIY